MATEIGRGIADRVRSYLVETETTQQALADALGERQYWVSRRLTYKAAISADDLVRIASVLGVPVNQFIPDEVAA